MHTPTLNRRGFHALLAGTAGWMTLPAVRAQPTSGGGAAAALQPVGRAPDAVWGSGAQVFTLATGSPGELGLLEVLARDFARRHDATMRWYKAGSGQAMAMLRNRQVDMVLAHAPAAERQAVAEGWATGRVLIGSNEFWILGPREDPAQVAQALDAVEAFRRIQDAGATFVSRGDNSGTHQKELQIWKAAGRDPLATKLIVTKDFMTASMKRANDEGAYFLTDSSTFIVERANMPRLQRLLRGGELLANPYHTLYLSEPTTGSATARRFGEWLGSEEVQALLRRFGQERHGEPMYNDAATTARLLAG
jgi:tungstate transport system substrate-binding protein